MTTIVWPEIEGIEVEHTPERLKVLLPVKRNKVWIAIYSLLLIIWWIGTVVFIVGIFNGLEYDMSTRALVVWVVIVLVWLLIWYRYVGKLVWRWWQYHVANRELLFIYTEEQSLIVRRPLSLLGVTDSYGLKYIKEPFYYSKRNDAVTFNFGARPIYFAHALEAPAIHELISTLNHHYFPDHDSEDEDEVY